jgi:regulator of cell morphogenesis and NO signaling
MEVDQNQIIGKLVARDYRTASIFKKYEIDFCCQGNRTIADAVENENLNLEAVLCDLQLVAESNEITMDFISWPLDVLTDYIEKKHHRYVDARSLEIKQYLNKICSVHGEHHPELFEIQQQFNAAAGELAAHMKKEEFILFPFIRKLAKASHENGSFNMPTFGSIQSLMALMQQDHQTEGERFRKIEELSDNYTPPEDACNTYRLSLSLLREFEQDLHLHIHLENNILFPGAIELEKELVTNNIH